MTIKPLRRPMHLIGAAALGVFGIVVLRTPLYGAASDAPIAPPALDNPKAAGAPQIVVLAGGCFWGVQGVFEHVRGVQRAVAGYAGGDKATAHYGTVGYGDDRAYGVREHHVRSSAGFLWTDIANCVFGRVRSDAAQPAGPGRWLAVSISYFLRR
jgi:hypothetical protein